MERFHGSDASLAIRYRRTSARKTKDDRYSIDGLTQTKVDVTIEMGRELAMLRRIKTASTVWNEQALANWK